MGESHYLVDILALLLATVVVVPFFHAIRLGAILGYLAAGVLLGPWGFGLITEIEEIRHLGEFGVIFLLFVLGIELKPEKLWQMRKLVIGLGLGQLLITAGVIFAIARAFDIPQDAALIIGFGLALSSTAFCLKLLAERGGISTRMGQMSFSVLLLQDLSVVPLLALVAYLAGDAASSGAASDFNFVYAIGIMVGLLVAGHYLLNPILGKIIASQDPDVFVALAVLLVLGMAWIMELIGFSMALGAFLAGMMLAESHYRHQIEADILPFRGILLGLFFMTVGMGIDFALLWNQFFVVIGLTIGLMFVKGIIVFILAKIGGAKSDVAAQTAVLLSQSGEFGFVMFGFATVSGVIETQLSNLMVLVIALTMVLTPFAVKLVNYLLNRFYSPAMEETDFSPLFKEHEGHIIIAGFGRVGARIGAILDNANVPYIALEFDKDIVNNARSQGFSVYYGDASKIKVLQAAGADRARMLVVTIDTLDTVGSLLPLVRQYYPNLPIHVRAKDRFQCAELVVQGASTAVSETLEASLSLCERVLLGCDLNEEEIDRVIDEFRDDYYSEVVKKIAEHHVVMGELKH